MLPAISFCLCEVCGRGPSRLQVTQALGFCCCCLLLRLDPLAQGERHRIEAQYAHADDIACLPAKHSALTLLMLPACPPDTTHIPLKKPTRQTQHTWAHIASLCARLRDAQVQAAPKMRQSLEWQEVAIALCSVVVALQSEQQASAHAYLFRCEVGSRRADAGSVAGWEPCKGGCMPQRLHLPLEMPAAHPEHAYAVTARHGRECDSPCASACNAEGHLCSHCLCPSVTQLWAPAPHARVLKTAACSSTTLNAEAAVGIRHMRVHRQQSSTREPSLQAELSESALTREALLQAELSESALGPPKPFRARQPCCISRGWRTQRTRRPHALSTHAPALSPRAHLPSSLESPPLCTTHFIL